MNWSNLQKFRKIHTLTSPASQLSTLDWIENRGQSLTQGSQYWLSWYSATTGTFVYTNSNRKGGGSVYTIAASYCRQSTMTAILLAGSLSGWRGEMRTLNQRYPKYDLTKEASYANQALDS